MDLGLDGKIAVTTASTAGLGLASALALAREGCRVVINGRDPARGEAALRLHPNFHFVEGDVCEESVREAVVAEALRTFGPPDILIGNTGGPRPSTALEEEPSGYETAARDLLVPLVHLAKLVVPQMRQRGWGRIVFITSGVVREPAESLVLSNSIRMAVHGFAKTLAREIAAFGVTVNCVMPGRIATERLVSLDETTARRSGRSVEEVRKFNEAAIPAGRYGTPEELGAVVAFLCSEKASYVTGAAVPVDGGLLRGHF